MMETAKRMQILEENVTVNFVGIQTKQEQERRQHAANLTQELLIRALREKPPEEKGEEVGAVGDVKGLERRVMR